MIDKPDRPNWQNEFAQIATRALVRETIEGYFSAVTLKAWDELPNLFARDCVLRSNRTEVADVHGRDAIVKMCSDIGNRYPLVMQMPHAIRVQLVASTASAITLVHEIVNVDETTRAFALAIYEDTLIETPNGWQFSDRYFRGVYRQNSAAPQQSRI